MIYAVDITAAIDAAGTLATLRYASKGFNTARADALSDTHYSERLKQPASLRREMFSGGSSGASRSSYGEMILVNTDGALDGLGNYGLDGRDCIIRVGNAGDPFPDAWPVVLKASMYQALADWRQVSIQLRDRFTLLDRPLLWRRYYGNNVLPAGIEGNADDLKNKIKPRLYGEVTGISPPCVNTTKLVYQVSDRAIYGVSAVYVRGASITSGADFGTSAALLAAALTPGTYGTCLAEGLFRLASSPDGAVTCDAQEAVPVLRTRGQMLARIAADMGITDISAADLAALDAASPARAGWWVSDDSTAASVMDSVAQPSVWYGFDRLGTLRFNRLAAPSGTPVVDLDGTNLIGNPQRVAPRTDTDRLPAWRVTLSCARNWTVQASDIAGAVTAARKAVIAQAAASAVAQDANVRLQYTNAQDLNFDSCLARPFDAASEAALLLGIYKVLRETWQVTLRVDDVATLTALDLGVVVRLTYPRFNFGSGKLMRVLAMDGNFADNKITLTLWG